MINTLTVNKIFLEINTYHKDDMKKDMKKDKLEPINNFELSHKF